MRRRCQDGSVLYVSEGSVVFVSRGRGERNEGEGGGGVESRGVVVFRRSGENRNEGE